MEPVGVRPRQTPANIFMQQVYVVLTVPDFT